MKTCALVLVSMTGVLAACGSEPAPAVPADARSIDADVAPRITATPSATIVTAGDAFTIAVEIDNFEVVNPTTTPGAELGTGHFHYQLDTWQNYTAAWTSSVSVATTGATPAGEHTVRLWLVDGNHAEIEPLVETTIRITVE